jgi:hypothetical protein
VVGAGVGEANQTYQIPLLHYVVVNAVDYHAGYIGYYDPEPLSRGGGQQWVSFAEFERMWGWNADRLPGQLLEANNVQSNTIIYNA